MTWREVESGIEGVVDEVGAITWMPSTRRFPGVEEGARAFSRHNLQVLYYPADHVWAVLAVHANFPLSVRLAGTFRDCRAAGSFSRSGALRVRLAGA